MDLYQLWADEMNGKVPTGTYHRALEETYPEQKEEDISLSSSKQRIEWLEEVNAQLLEALKICQVRIFMFDGSENKPYKIARKAIDLATGKEMI